VDLSLAKRVLVQLVTNAQLYSSQGKPIVITTKQRDKFHDISVADQGPGIEEEEIEHIFEKFYRGENVRYCVPGTGMGLPIAKMIVEAHGGTIVSPTVQDGVRFSPSACQQNATGIRNTPSGTCAAS
jgi:signal transduction histidine kinase